MMYRLVGCFLLLNLNCVCLNHSFASRLLEEEKSNRTSLRFKSSSLQDEKSDKRLSKRLFASKNSLSILHEDSNTEKTLGSRKRQHSGLEVQQDKKETKRVRTSSRLSASSLNEKNLTKRNLRRNKNSEVNSSTSESLSETKSIFKTKRKNDLIPALSEGHKEDQKIKKFKSSCSHPLGFPDYLLNLIQKEKEKRNCTLSNNKSLGKEKNYVFPWPNNLEHNIKNLGPIFNKVIGGVHQASPDLPSSSTMMIPKPSLVEKFKGERKSRHATEFRKSTDGQTPKEYLDTQGHPEKNPSHILHLQSHMNGGPVRDITPNNLVLGSPMTNRVMIAADRQYVPGELDANRASVYPGTRIGKDILQMTLNPQVGLPTAYTTIPAYINSREGYDKKSQENKQAFDPAPRNVIYLMQMLAAHTGNKDTWKNAEDVTKEAFTHVKL